jgi:hypothetical protein
MTPSTTARAAMLGQAQQHMGSAVVDLREAPDLTAA